MNAIPSPQSPAPSPHLTTGAIARLLAVSPRTVSAWIDSGILPGWRLPGGRRERRVEWDALVRFCAAYDLPLAALVRMAEEDGRGLRVEGREPEEDPEPDPPPVAEATCSVHMRAA